MKCASAVSDSIFRRLDGVHRDERDGHKEHKETQKKEQEHRPSSLDLHFLLLFVFFVAILRTISPPRGPTRELRSCLSLEPQWGIGAPLRGPGWISFGSPSDEGSHRRTILRFGGQLFLAQRYAIDWGGIDAEGRLLREGGEQHKPEFRTANPQGLGFVLMDAQQSLRPDLMFAYLVWVGIIGCCSTR